MPQGVVHKGRPQRRREGALVKCGHMRTAGEGGKGPCGRPQAGTFSLLFQHALQTLSVDDAY